MRHFFKKQILVLFILIASISARAQYDASASLSLGMGHGYTALSQSVMSNAFAATGKNKTTTKVTNADYIYLGFSHYRDFEQKVFNQVLQNAPNTDKGKIRSFLSSTRTMYNFDTRSRAFGLKDTYIADILATGIAWNWEMYHQTKASTAKVVELRNSIRNNIDKSAIKSQIQKLSDQDKRDWMLSFMYNNSMLAQIIKNSGKLTNQQKQQLVTTAKQAGVPNIAAVSLK